MLRALVFTKCSDSIYLHNKSTTVFANRLIRSAVLWELPFVFKMSKKNSIQSEPPTKKAKVEANVKSDSDSKTFLLEIVSNRGKCSVDISNFKFNKNRCKMLSESQDVGDAGGGILYWMSRDQRVQGMYKLYYFFQFFNPDYLSLQTTGLFSMLNALPLSWNYLCMFVSA